MSYKGLLENGKNQYAAYLRNGNLEDVETLNVREFEVLTLVSHGLTSKEIATYLHFSSETIKAHRKSILFKTSSKNMTEAVCIAIRRGWIS